MDIDQYISVSDQYIYMYIDQLFELTKNVVGK